MYSLSIICTRNTIRKDLAGDPTFSPSGNQTFHV